MPREPQPPRPTSLQRSRIMSAVRHDNTEPERMLQCALRRLGTRFSTNCRGLPGSPDIVFRRHSVAVFVHGCFWHRHSACPLASTPKSNVSYWRAKFRANVARDRRKEAELVRLGWKVVVAWQCEIRADADAVAQRIHRVLARTSDASERLRSELRAAASSSGSLRRSSPVSRR